MSRCQELTGQFSLSILYDLGERVDMTHAKKINLIFDCGPHFRSYEVVATMGTSWIGKFWKDVTLLFGLECHLKGRIDGFFSLLNSVKSQVAVIPIKYKIP